MIVSSCPLRISLAGGSTDHPHFIDRYGTGSVISFASNLRTYVSIHQDAFGMNSVEHKYSINYSKKECVQNIDDIQNELIRHCFEYFNVEEINCSLTSDIYSVGSGLAASSSYLLSLIKSIYIMRGKSISEFEICQIAEEIEKKFNPLVGQQDFYGSLGGLKRLDFYKGKSPKIKHLTTRIFEEMDCHLIYTGILRKSTQILETIDTEKSKILLQDVEDLETAIDECDVTAFNQIIRRSWDNKKMTSAHICDSEQLKKLDDDLSKNTNVLSHRLCGAGGGGYFLAFSKKNSSIEYQHSKRIFISENGIKHIQLKDGFVYI